MTWVLAGEEVSKVLNRYVSFRILSVSKISYSSPSFLSRHCENMWCLCLPLSTILHDSFVSRRSLLHSKLSRGHLLISSWFFLQLNLQTLNLWFGVPVVNFFSLASSVLHCAMRSKALSSDELFSASQPQMIASSTPLLPNICLLK